MWRLETNPSISAGKEQECGQADDNEPSETIAQQTSPCKRQKLISDVAEEEGGNRNLVAARKAEAVLEGQELWQCFYRLGTEMIITKSGRRMFPPLRVSFTDVQPSETYTVMLDIVPLDNKRHRYSYTDSAWFVAGEADPTPPRRVYVHPESPFSGEELSRQVLSFERVKLTNNPKDTNSNIILNSMHKYQPRVHLLRNPADTSYEEQLDKADTFIFAETAFMAVTAYQNHLITRLKIYSNPFAKGFRDTTRLLPNFHEEGFILHADEYPGCCDCSREGICSCHLAVSRYHQTDVSRDSTDDTQWMWREDCCRGSEYTWRSPHAPANTYIRSTDIYSVDSTRPRLIACPPILSEERQSDF